ncbi:MAG: integrase [Deltaproteobacteria bacterium]|nr:integrase [Deltaproteobacteria bacterium]
MLEPMPVAPTTLALYISARASSGAKVATLSQALAAIGEAHRLAGHEAPMRAPVVRETWKGIRRQLGTAQRQVRPLLAGDVCTLVAALPATLRGVRDRALVTLGFAGTFRPSELGAIGVGDVAFVEDGLTIMLRRSKGDPEGAGETVGIPWGTSPDTCPVRAVRAWLSASAIEEGPLLRGVVHGRVRGAARRARGFASGGLQRALAPRRARDIRRARGKPDRAIMCQGRWRSRAMLDRYVRDATLFRDNAAAGLGL